MRPFSEKSRHLRRSYRPTLARVSGAPAGATWKRCEQKNAGAVPACYVIFVDEYDITLADARPNVSQSSHHISGLYGVRGEGVSASSRAGIASRPLLPRPTPLPAPHPKSPPTTQVNNFDHEHAQAAQPRHRIRHQYDRTVARRPPTSPLLLRNRPLSRRHLTSLTASTSSPSDSNNNRAAVSSPTHPCPFAIASARAT